MLRQHKRSEVKLNKKKELLILLPKNITLAEIPQRNGKVVINPTDKPTGNGRSNQALTLDEDWLICEVRRLAWLSLDDLHQILLPMFPKLSRSALHCLLKYYGISKKPKELQAKPTGSKFKSYEVGYLHIDITNFWLDEKRWSLFVVKCNPKVHQYAVQKCTT